MSDPNDPLIDALAPITSRVRTDKTAVKPKGSRLAFWTGTEKTGPVEALTPERMARHLNGGPARGVCPIREGESTVLLALLDFDSHKGEVGWVEMSAVVGRVIDVLQLAWGACPVLFRSTGGMGVHLYLLWDAPQDAHSVRVWLQGVLVAAGLRDGTGGVRAGQVEVFPKQPSVPVGGSGNMFILPMAGKGAPLVWEDLSGMLVPQDPAWLLGGAWWGVSDPVPVAERETRAVSEGPVADVGDGALLWQVLDAIPNGSADRGGVGELAYDRWLRVVLAVHRECRGSDEGLARVRAWSARSGKHTDAELEKQWAWADWEKAGAVGLGSLKWEAGQWGWVDPDLVPNADDFDVVPVVQEPRRYAGGAGGAGAAGGAAGLGLAVGGLGLAVGGLGLAVGGLGLAVGGLGLAVGGLGLADRVSACTAPGGPGWPIPDELPAFDREKTGAIKPTVTNTVLALRRPDLADRRVAYDEFRDEIAVSRVGADEWVPLVDADLVRMRMRLETVGFKGVPKELARDALVLVAAENRMDSAQLWLQGVEARWDGVRRVDRFLIDYMGCADTEYVRAVGRYLWTALAGRVIDPGVKADMVVIYEGAQGLRKSSAIEALVPAPEFFVEVDLEEDETNTVRKLRGALVGEIAELSGLHTRALEAIKKFVVRKVEKWVPKYKEFPSTFARRLVFVGTTNRTDILADETGNRRWLPVHIERADAEGIARDREQLWAEGAAMYRGLVGADRGLVGADRGLVGADRGLVGADRGLVGGVAWQDAERLAGAEHDAYTVEDPWSGPIAAWLGEVDGFNVAGGARGGAPFTSSELLVGALSIPLRDMDRLAQKRISAILKRMGYINRTIRRRGVAEWGWVRPKAAEPE